MTVLMRKMKPTACSCSNVEMGDDRRIVPRVTGHSVLPNSNSQIAEQSHISKKFDEKSSHLLLLLLRCALRCLLFPVFFFYLFVCYFSRFDVSLVPGTKVPLRECGAKRKCRLNLEWSKTINSKQCGIAMPTAKHTMNLRIRDRQKIEMAMQRHKRNCNTY